MEIPTVFYAVAGFVVLTNFGVILTIIGLVFKAGGFVAETRLGIKDSKDTGVRAHKRIDKLEDSNV